MRHRMKGRKLGRNGSHRKAMFRNMAASLIKTLDQEDNFEGAAKVPGRIITTTQKAKELRPQIERLVTIARKAAVIEENARELESGAEKGSDEWKQWRQSEKWNEWAQAVAPAVALRRRAYAALRDHDAVSIEAKRGRAQPDGTVGVEDQTLLTQIRDGRFDLAVVVERLFIEVVVEHDVDLF